MGRKNRKVKVRQAKPRYQPKWHEPINGTDIVNNSLVVALGAYREVVS